MKAYRRVWVGEGGRGGEGRGGEGRGGEGRGGEGRGGEGRGGGWEGKGRKGYLVQWWLAQHLCTRGSASLFVSGVMKASAAAHTQEPEKKLGWWATSQLVLFIKQEKYNCISGCSGFTHITVISPRYWLFRVYTHHSHQPEILAVQGLHTSQSSPQDTGCSGFTHITVFTPRYWLFRVLDLQNTVVKLLIY